MGNDTFDSDNDDETVSDGGETLPQYDGEITTEDATVDELLDVYRKVNDD